MPLFSFFIRRIQAQITCWRLNGRPVAETKWNWECKQHFEHKVYFFSSNSLWLRSFLILQGMQGGEVERCRLERQRGQGWYFDRVPGAHPAVQHGLPWHSGGIRGQGTWSSSVPLQAAKVTPEGSSRVKVTHVGCKWALPKEKAMTLCCQLGIWAGWRLFAWPQDCAGSIW